MNRNEGNVDRGIRIALGLGLLATIFIGRAAPWMGALALVLLVTGLVGFCPLYKVIGVRTCPARA